MKGFEESRLLKLFLLFLPLILLVSEKEGIAAATEEMDLELEDLLNIKVSVASKKEEAVSDAPGVIYVISQDELRRLGAVALKEILMMVPGIGFANCSLTNRSLPVMRGDLIKPNSSHILFLLNGRPIREVQEGGVNSDFIESFPADVIEQIEVIRGPGSVLYGSDAFSGVVNVITRKPADDPLSVSLMGHYEPSSGGGGMATVMSKLGDLKMVASGRYYRKPDWNTEFMKKVLVPYLDMTTRSINYRIVDSVFAMNIKDEGPGVFFDLSYKGLSAMGTFVQWTTSAFQVPNESVRGRKFTGNVGYKIDLLENWHTEINATGTQTGLLADDLPFIERKSNNMLLENTHFLELFDNLNIVGGGTVSYIDGREDYLFPVTMGQKPYMVSEGKRWAFSGYGQVDYTLFNKLKLILGLQGNKTRGIKKHIAPRIGAIWRPIDKISLKALYSEAFRLPSINELFMNFNVGLYGNEKLMPEIVKTTDIGISYNNERLMLGYNFFFSKQMDIIQPVFLKGSTTARMYDNVGTINFIGAEVEGKAYITKELLVNGSLMYQNNYQDDSTGRHINLVPIGNFIIKGGISYAHPEGITASLVDAFQSEPSKKFKGNLNNSDTTINNYDHINNGPFNLVNFYLQFDIARFFEFKSVIEPSLIFKVENIVGKEIWMYELLGYLNDIYPTIRGREFFLGINIKI